MAKGDDMTGLATARYWKGKPATGLATVRYWRDGSNSAGNCTVLKGRQQQCRQLHGTKC